MRLVLSAQMRTQKGSQSPGKASDATHQQQLLAGHEVLLALELCDQTKKKTQAARQQTESKQCNIEQTK